MFPNHLLLALCVVGFACLAYCGDVSYGQSSSPGQAAIPVSSAANDLVAEFAKADACNREAILEQLKVVELASVKPLLSILSPTLNLDSEIRWQAIEVMYPRYLSADEKLSAQAQSAAIQRKLRDLAVSVCNQWLSQGQQGVDQLLAASESPIVALRQQALLSLRNAKELPTAALDRLQQQLSKNQYSMDLALLLGKHGRVPAEAVPALLSALNTRSSGGCMYCAPSTQRDESSNAKLALSHIDSSAAAAVPHLIEALKIENVEVRSTVAEALGKIGPAAKEAIPALIAARDCKIVRPAPPGAVGFFGPPAPRTFAIPAEATWALARIQTTEAKDDQQPMAQATSAETDPDLLTKTLPGAWKIEITIAPKLLQRPIQETRDYLYLIATIQGGFQAQACQAKIGANSLASIQLPKIGDTEKKSELEELPVKWKVFKNKDGKTTLTVNHPGVGDLLFQGPIRQLDADRVECEIMAPLPGDKPEEPSLPIFVVKLQRVKP